MTMWYPEQIDDGPSALSIARASDPARGAGAVSGSEAPAIRRSSCALLLAILLAACAESNAGDPEVVLVADRKRIEAMVAADPERLDLALHESLSYSHSNGRVDSKASLVDKLVSGGVDYVSIDLANPQVRRHGDAAVVTAPMNMKVVAAGETYQLASIYTAVYWFEDGRWQLVAYHSSGVTP